MPTPFDADEVLRLPLVANLATVDPEGAPRNAPVWFCWEGGVLSMLSDHTASSARRVRHDPRVAVEVVHYDNAKGIMRHVGLRGRATVEPMDEALFHRLLTRYLGADEAAWNGWFVENVARITDQSGRLIQLAPETVFTNDVSYFRTGPRFATG